MGADLQGLLSDIEKEGGIPEWLKERLQKTYGTKFRKAEEAVSSMAVKKYAFKPSRRIVWIVVGREKEYFLIPEFYCQCDDFYINVVIRRKANLCYHILAQAIAERLGRFEKFEVPDNDFIRLNSEWKKQSV
jgi:predicted nucleic acid-binding Zn finger protein